MQITSKREFFAKWRAGLLGNRTELWTDPYDVWEAINGGLDKVGFREIGRAGGGAWELVPAAEFMTTYDRWVQAKRTFIMDGSVPNEKRTLQGEIARTYRGLEGYLDTQGTLAMRPAMAAGHMKTCGGALVMALLDRYMDDNSREDLQMLLDLYPDATIEFTCFSCDVGMFLNRNTIFWETRNY